MKFWTGGVMSCKFILAKKSNRSLTWILLTIILKLSRRLNCLVLPSSVISSGTAKLTTSWRKLIKKCLCFVNSRLQVWTPRNYLLSTRGKLGYYLNMLPLCGTQVLLNSRLTRLRTFRSECANTPLVGTTNPTPNLLLHWRWKPYMTGVSIFAGILLARYLLLIDSQLGFPPVQNSIMQLRKSRVVKLFRYKTERFKSSPLPYMANLLNSWSLLVYSPSAITFRPWLWHSILPVFFLFMYVYIYLIL